MDGILGHHSRGKSDEELGNVRYDFVLETREEEDGDFGDGREVGIGCPDLVAQKCKVPCRRDDATVVSGR